MLYRALDVVSVHRHAVFLLCVLLHHIDDLVLVVRPNHEVAILLRAFELVCHVVSPSPCRGGNGDETRVSNASGSASDTAPALFEHVVHPPEQFGSNLLPHVPLLDSRPRPPTDSFVFRPVDQQRDHLPHEFVQRLPDAAVVVVLGVDALLAELLQSSAMVGRSFSFRFEVDVIGDCILGYGYFRICTNQISWSVCVCEVQPIANDMWSLPVAGLWIRFRQRSVPSSRANAPT